MIDHKPNFLKLALVAALALVLGACDADSPTEPARTPNPPPPTSSTSTFAITVSLNPGTVEAGATSPAIVTVTARRTDTNQPVPRGSTAVLTTTSGTLTNAAGATGATVAISFDVNGRAEATASPLETAIIRAQIEQSFGQATLTVAEAPEVEPFSLFGVTPNFGPPAGGTEVRIEGSGISLPTEVLFGGQRVEPLSISSNSIRIRTPPVDLPSGQNQTVSVTVSINVGDEDAASDTLGGAYTYTRNQSPVIPKIISLTPTSGPNEGGTEVAITGEAFGPEIQVFFGDASRVESRILSLSSSRIVVETPPATGQNSGNRNATVSVRVVDLNSGFQASLSGAFQFGTSEMFISAVQPTEGTYFGGTLVTIFGTGFEAPVAITFGNEDQQPVSVSGTEVVARSVAIETACNPQPGATTVVNIETNESVTGPAFQYRTPEPEIGSISPDATTADVDTGFIVFGSPTTLTMTGAGFDRQGKPPVVSFGGVVSPGVVVTSLDPNPLHDGFGVGDIMSVDIPRAPTPWPEMACMVGSDSGMEYIDQEVAVVVTARDTGCSSEGLVTILFTYFPNDPSCRIPPPAP